MRATSALVTARGPRLAAPPGRGTGPPPWRGPAGGIQVTQQRRHPGHPPRGCPAQGRAPEAVWPLRAGTDPGSGAVPVDRGLRSPSLRRGRRGDPAAGGSRVPLFRVQGFPGWSLWQLHRLSPGLLGAAPACQTGKLRQAVGPGAGGRREGTPRAGFLSGAPLSQPARGGALLPKRPDQDNGGKKRLARLIKPDRSPPGRLRNVGMLRGPPPGREAGERLPGGR